MKDFIHISDFPEDKIYVLLEKTYRKEIIDKSILNLNRGNYSNLSILINDRFKAKFNSGDIKYWIEGKKIDVRTGVEHPKFMPLWLALFLVKSAGENIKTIDKHVVAYRSGGKGLIINKPNLPIKVTPELDSILIHLFGDGCAGDFTPSYFQKDKSAFYNFITKLENCFGNFEKSIYSIRGQWQIKFPKAISDVISSFYSVHSYMSYESKIPDAILERKDKNYKLACIVAYIVDEGYIRDVISLYSVNKILISGIRKLVMDCGYDCSELQFNRKAGNSYIFNIYVKEAEKFYNDICNLSKIFPTCTLLFKEEPLKFILKRQAIKNPRDRDVTQQVVIGALKRKDLTTGQISKIVNYAHSTIVHTLRDLYGEKRVNRIKQKDKSYLWSLTEFSKK